MKSRVRSVVLAVCLVLMFSACTATPVGPPSLAGRVTTWLGFPGECSHVDGPGNSARLSAPTALTADGNGGLLIVDAGTIRRSTPAGDLATEAGSPGQYGLVDGVGSDARVWVAGPSLDVDDAGDLWFAQMSDNVIRQMTPPGAVSTDVGIPWSGTLVDPGSREGPAEEVYLLFAMGVAEHEGTLCVSESRAIRKVADATVSVLWSDDPFAPVGAGEMEAGFPIAIAVADDGWIWVHDGHGAVYTLDQAGHLTLVAGEPGSYGSADGAGTAARFGGSLYGLASGPDGAHTSPTAR